MRLTMRPEDLKEQFGFEFSLKKWNFRLTAEVLLLTRDLVCNRRHCAPV